MKYLGCEMCDRKSKVEVIHGKYQHNMIVFSFYNPISNSRDYYDFCGIVCFYRWVKETFDSEATEK